MAPGAYVVMMLFLFTVFLSASFHGSLHLPPVLGMMTGLGVLQLFGFFAGYQYHGMTGSGHGKHARAGALHHTHQTYTQGGSARNVVTPRWAALASCCLLLGCARRLTCLNSDRRLGGTPG